MSGQRVAWWATAVAASSISYRCVGWWNLLIAAGAYIGAWSMYIDLTEKLGKP